MANFIQERKLLSKHTNWQGTIICIILGKQMVKETEKAPEVEQGIQTRQKVSINGKSLEENLFSDFS